jgi:AcrR family transcriptional regulator
LTKGEHTREMILLRAAQVFNRKGFFGASMSDIMEATGLEKGGIYNYFHSKDDLALQAFDYAMDLVREEFAAAIKGKFHAIDRLQAVLQVYRRIAAGEPLAGGCPVLNTAIEADDAHPALKGRARDAMQELHDFIARLVQRGVERGELRPGTDPQEAASLILSTLEGAVMLTRLSSDSTYMDRAIAHLTWYLDSTLRA